MGKKICVLFTGSIYSQRGLFNAVRERVKYLKACSDFDIDVYILSQYEPWYVRLLRKTPKKDCPQTIELDGIQYRIIWSKFSLINYLLQVKLYCSGFFANKNYKKIARQIRGYDLISAHSYDAGCVANYISKRDNIPFFVTWHGSDIHSAPFENESIYNKTKLLLNDAECNFFVSNNLKNTAFGISDTIKAQVLFNGINSSFYLYPVEEKKKLRQQKNISEGCKVVAFVGNLIDVKNPYILPPLFDAVYKKYGSSKLLFWIIGSGKEEEQIKRQIEKNNTPCIFWGGQSPEAMPDFMNCIDVLVLPSKNEGLALVLLEAIRCGASAVGSNVGGIEEVVGAENVFPLDENFVENMSSRIVYMLDNKVEQCINPNFSWEITAEKEKNIYINV